MIQYYYIMVLTCLTPPPPHKSVWSSNRDFEVKNATSWWPVQYEKTTHFTLLSLLLKQQQKTKLFSHLTSVIQSDYSVYIFYIIFYPSTTISATFCELNVHWFEREGEKFNVVLWDLLCQYRAILHDRTTHTINDATHSSLSSASMSCYVIYIQLISLGKFNVSLKVYKARRRWCPEGNNSCAMDWEWL